jgi:DNA-binding transcriptional ArsR family regulator
MEPDLKQLASIDRVIHEPARLMIVSLLAAVEEADFQYLHQATGLTKGNLSVHLSKLEAAGYVAIEKTYRGKVPLTLCRLTASGAEALARYKAVMKAAL